MKSFLRVKSVDSGLAQLLHAFSIQYDLKSPVNNIYAINDRVPLENWLKKIKFIDKQYQKEGLGLEIAKLINAKHLGICNYMAMSCQNLYEYLDISLKYNRILYDNVEKKIVYEKNQIIIFWGKPAYYKAGLYLRETEIADELQVALYYQQLLTITKTSIPIFNKVELAIPTPKSTKLYEDYFQCPVKFCSNKTAIYIKREIFGLPIETSDSTLLTLLKLQADAQLDALPKNKSFIELVNINIIRAIKNQDPRIHIVAEYFNMSSRTLQNILKEEGVKYQDLLSNARLSLAKQYLLNPELSIIKISDLLGYKEQTSFNRVFKNWTGESPLRWRELNLNSENKVIEHI